MKPKLPDPLLEAATVPKPLRVDPEVEVPNVVAPNDGPVVFGSAAGDGAPPRDEVIPNPEEPIEKEE